MWNVSTSERVPKLDGIIFGDKSETYECSVHKVKLIMMPMLLKFK